MNVYTNVSYRRQGVARMLVQMLINEAKEKRVTEIFHISTTWKRFGDIFKVIFNMDSVAHIS